MDRSVHEALRPERTPLAFELARPKESGMVERGIFYDSSRKRFRPSFRRSQLGSFLTVDGARAARDEAVKSAKDAKTLLKIEKLQAQIKELEETL
tara:strand:- start:401 stop:685 length:285 start_codon:yes stop_codon:yes gene_type:complete